MSRWSALLAAAVLATAAACSRSGEAPAAVGTPEASTRRSPAPAPRPPVEPRRIDPRRGGLQVGFGEFAVTPEAARIRPGNVTFVIRNGGKLVHGFELKAEDGGSNSGPGGGGDDRLKIETRTFRPGETIRVAATLTPGLYELECYVADHDDRGMETLLRVEPNAPLVEDTTTAPDAVAMEGFAFVPSSIRIARGTRVTWTNRDAAPHTVTSDDGAFGSDPLNRGGTFSHTFTRPGLFAYRCAIHPPMKGTVRVG